MRYSISHIHSFTKEAALAALKDTGYEIIDYCYTNYATEIPTNSFNRKLAMFPRKIFGHFSPDMAAHILGGYKLLVLTQKA
jgi:hypothetical protein